MVFIDLEAFLRELNAECGDVKRIYASNQAYQNGVLEGIRFARVIASSEAAKPRNIKERPATAPQHSDGASPEGEICPSCTGCELRNKGCMEKPGSVACARDAGKLRHC